MRACCSWIAATQLELFSLTDYGGVMVAKLGPGRYRRIQLSAMGFPDNYVQSVRVPPGWEVTVFGGGSLERRDNNPSADLQS